MTVFGNDYAGAYDSLYREKDYAGECNMIEALVGNFKAHHSVRRIVDFGCGTGNHAIPLASRGYEVAGIDLSPAMLKRAREKAAAVGLQDKTSFHHGDIRTARLAGTAYDAAIMMFAVLGYQKTENDVRSALDAVRYHLSPGAPFVFDVWYGPAVLADPPGVRERRIENAEGVLIRRSNSVLDHESHLCTVQFDLEEWKAGQRILHTREDHVMRFFFPEELESFAGAAGFRCAALRDFALYEKAATVRSWNVVGVFVAV